MTSSLSSVEENTLVLSAKQGSLDAFNLLYEKYFPLVVRRVRYLIPEEDVEDVTQEVFIGVMRSLKSFRGEAKFSTWLRVLTSRQIAEFYRRRKPPVLPMDEGMRDQLDPCPSDDVRLLRQIFQHLPARYREILLLRFAEDLSFREIAVLQNRSLEATKSIFRRAVSALSKMVMSDEPSKR